MTVPPDPQTCRWHAVADLPALHRAVAARVLAAERRALHARGRFVLVLAGGATPRGAYGLLREANASWSAWNIYFGDERCVASHDARRNSRMARSAWLDHVAIPSANIHEIAAELDAAGALPVWGAPKPPPERVTMSARRFSATAEAVFMVFGAEKRAAVDRWRAGELIPARFIVPEAGVEPFVGAYRLL